MSKLYHGDFGKLNIISNMENATLTQLSAVVGNRQTWKKLVDKYPEFFTPINHINKNIIIYKLNLPCGIVSFYKDEKLKNLSNRANVGRKKKYT